ncbi:MAG: OmpA family protein [Flavisolibacter sp.]|jgi:outer membrane protein OmpA-like peptidoglycan-associated protein|nr:OmpA family protein [Flavisolibacter sp.]
MKLFTFLLYMTFGIFAHAQTRDTSLILFEFDSYTLSPSAKVQLQRWVNTYQQQKGDIILYGHCDAKGSHEYNDQLSENRSNAVKEWLEQHGVASSAISMVKGFGKRNPLNENKNDDEREINRRVEIILEKKEIPVVTETTEEPPKILLKETIDSLKVGDKLVLPHINFQGGLHRFLPSALPSLEELLKAMQSNPALEIEIQGHICCRAGVEQDGIDLETRQYNLSAARARAVYDYLVSNGIKKNRMRYKGFAGMFPLVSPELSEADRTANRRVEILVLKR